MHINIPQAPVELAPNMKELVISADVSDFPAVEQEIRCVFQISSTAQLQFENCTPLLENLQPVASVIMLPLQQEKWVCPIEHV
jgi:hypothetical protein